MNPTVIANTLASYFLFYSVCFVPSLCIALGEKGWLMALVFGGTFLFTFLVGLVLFLLTRTQKKKSYFTKKEGLLIVSLIWIFSGIIGGIPFYFSGEIPLIISAIFESVSGFTTTGASVLVDVERLPQSLLFWRSFTHWLGGLGIVVLFVAILPYLGVGGRVLFQSEVPGPETEVLKPKIQETAFSLLKIYLFFTVVETILLMIFGMTLFDALCHTFGTLATGGFSTKNASIAHYQSFEIELVIIIFMILAGVNFSLYFYFLRGEKKTFFQNSEFRVYLGIIFFATVAIALHLNFYLHNDLLTSFRDSFFHVVSIQTTTGYGAGDFAKWTDFAKLLLLVLMLVGGCAGSTGGGVKVIRWMIVVKYIFSQLECVFRPKAIKPVKVQKKPLNEQMIKSVLALVCLWAFVLVLVSLILTAMGMDMITSTTATMATLNNIGPGLGAVGPTSNFSTIPEAAKALLILCMLFGRLEIYTLIILFLPSFWRK